MQSATARSTFAPQAASDLPDGVVVFDGECVLCSGWVKFILSRDSQQRFRFASIQRMPGRAIAARLDIDPEAPATNVVIVDGVAYFKADSTLAVLRRLDGWRWTRIARLCPRFIRDWIYDRIARNRYSLFGRSASCLVPGPEQAARFLDQPPTRLQ
jgi:predicted DCC family thiol-disulfide oxidoreductase YuxK